MALHDTVPSFYDPAIPIDFKIIFFFCKNEANSDCSSYSFFYRQHLSCEGFLPPLSTQPSLACSLPFLARGCLPTLIKPHFHPRPSPHRPPSTETVTNSNIALQKRKIQDNIIEQICMNKKKSEESPIFRFRGYPSFSVGKGFRNFRGSGMFRPCF